MDMKSAMDRLVQKAEQNKRVSGGDYIGADGLLYCGKCHTAKQCKIKWWQGSELTLPCACRCEAEEHKRQAEREKKEEEERQKRLQEQERISRIENNRSNGFPDQSMMRCRFEHDDKANAKVTKIAKNYVNHFDEFRDKGKGIVFCGGVGTGKTYMASCIANALIDRGYTALVTNFPRIVNTLSGMFEGKQAYIDSLNEFDLLVIDDLATERDTEYMNEIVYTIIDSRYRSGKPLIVTTNLSYGAIRNPGDVSKQRIFSRITEMCYPVAVEGKDRRSEHMNRGLYDLLNS